MNYVHLLTETGGTIGYVLLGISILSGALILVLLSVLPFQDRLARRHAHGFLETVAPNAFAMATLKEIPKISSALGLLGTVVGMIGAFGNMKGRPEMSVLSGYLSKAMITTWAGLGIAVVDQVAYFVVKRCTRSAVADAAQRLGRQSPEDVGHALARIVRYTVQQRECFAEVLAELKAQTKALAEVQRALSCFSQANDAPPTRTAMTLTRGQRREQPGPNSDAEHETRAAAMGRNGTAVTEVTVPNSNGEKWYMKTDGGSLVHVLMVSDGECELVSPDEACARLDVSSACADKLARGLDKWPIRHLEQQEEALVLGLFDRCHRAGRAQVIRTR